MVVHSFLAVKRIGVISWAQMCCGREINAEKEIRKYAGLFQVEA